MIGDVLSDNIDVAELLGRIEKLLPNIKTDPRLRTCRDMQLLSLTCSRYVGPKLSILSFIYYEELKEASSCVQKDAGELFFLFGKFFECLQPLVPDHKELLLAEMDTAFNDLKRLNVRSGLMVAVILLDGDLIRASLEPSVKNKKTSEVGEYSTS